VQFRGDGSHRSIDHRVQPRRQLQWRSSRRRLCPRGAGKKDAKGIPHNRLAYYFSLLGQGFACPDRTTGPPSCQPAAPVTSYSGNRFQESTMKPILSLLCAGLLAGAAAPAFAHHSFAAEFDDKQPVTVRGNVTNVEWLNPHVWLYLDVKDES